jgi:hypothetical protein
MTTFQKSRSGLEVSCNTSDTYSGTLNFARPRSPAQTRHELRTSGDRFDARLRRVRVCECQSDLSRPRPAGRQSHWRDIACGAVLSEAASHRGENRFDTSANLDWGRHVMWQWVGVQERIFRDNLVAQTPFRSAEKDFNGRACHVRSACPIGHPAPRNPMPSARVARRRRAQPSRGRALRSPWSR